MKTIRKALAIGVAIAAAVACRPSSGKDVKTETLDYEDSTAHSRLEIKAELPKPGQGAAVDRIRAALIEVMDGQLSHIGAIIYFIHPAVERLCYFLRVYLSSLGIIWYQALYFITIVCLSWAIAYLIVKLAGNRRTAFLRYLFT